MIWVINTAGNGTWTVPSGAVNPVTVHCWGAGGGGGSGDDSNGPGAGGGGGGYSRAPYTVTLGQQFNYQVGAGGAANVDGTDTWFGSSTAQLAGGGGCGDNANDGDQGGGPGGGTGGTSYQTGNSLSTNIGTVTYAGAYGAQGGQPTFFGTLVNVGGAGGGSATACQRGGKPSDITGIPSDSKNFILAPGPGQGMGGSGALGLPSGWIDNINSTPGTYAGGGGGGGATTTLTASSGGNGLIVIADSAAPPLNNYIGGGTGSWNTASDWSLGRVPQNGDAVTFNSLVCSGTATNVTSSSLTLASGQSFAANLLQTYTLKITAAGSGSGQTVTLTGNTNANPSVVSLSSWPSGTPTGAVQYQITDGGGPNGTNGPTSLLVLASFDSNTGVTTGDSCGTNSNVMIAPGGTMVMGPLGGWLGNAASAQSCTISSNALNAGLCNNTTFNGDSYVGIPGGNASIGYSYNALFGVTTWNSNQEIFGSAGFPVLTLPLANEQINLIVPANISPVELAGLVAAAGDTGSGNLGCQLNVQIRSAKPVRRAL
jgi:glycine rich protein